jgi:peptidoglycan glycosyltransferase
MSPLNKRISFIAIFLVLCFFLLFLQLNNLQIKQANSLVNSKYNPLNNVTLSNLPRGSIITRDNYVLAYSKKVNDQYKELRIYPYGSLFSMIVGYDSLYYGVSGLEAVYNKYLETHLDNGQHLSDLNSAIDQTDNVVLTVSFQLQLQAQQALRSVIGQNGTGAVVAINPRNGDILAMYSQPSFDPNFLAEHLISQEKKYWSSLNPSSPTTPLLSQAYSQIYAPGSTFKIVTTSAAFDRPPYPNFAQTFSAPYVSEIPLPDSNLGLHNYAYEVCGGHIPYLLEVSCDTGYGLIGLKLGYPSLSQEADSFGFNSTPPLDETNVAKSVFPPACSVMPYIAYCAIGQYDVSASALQMALAAAGIANDGVIMTPHLMYEITNGFGQVVKKYLPTPWKFATSAQTASQVKSDMILVAQGGTAAGLFPSNLVVAAKTGTAQTAKSAGDNNWLLAFGPAGQGQTPKVAVAVVVPYQPSLPLDTTGAQIAGPVAAKVLVDALNDGLG